MLAGLSVKGTSLSRTGKAALLLLAAVVAAVYLMGVGSERSSAAGDVSTVGSTLSPGASAENHSLPENSIENPIDVTQPSELPGSVGPRFSEQIEDSADSPLAANGALSEKTPPVHYNLGAVEHAPHVFVIFWGSNWNQRTAMRSKILELFGWVNNSSYAGIWSQYFDHSGYISKEVALTSFTDTATPAPQSISRESVRGEIANAAASQGWPSATYDSDYLVLPAPQSSYQAGFQEGCGYHEYVREWNTSALFAGFPEGSYQTSRELPWGD